MKSAHRKGILEISLTLTALSLLLPQSEAFFLNLPGMANRCCPPPQPACCNMHHQPSSSGFGSQLFSSYGVGRMFAPSTSNAYAVAQPAGNAYAVAPVGYATQPAHPWAAHMHQQFAQHVAAGHQHWHSHQVQYPMQPSYPSAVAGSPHTSVSDPNYGYQTTQSATPEATTSVDEASFFGDNQVYESTPPPSPFSEQIDEEPTTMYSTDQTREPLRETPSGYTFTAPPAPQPPETAPIQVESSSTQTESGSYFRSKPPKLLQPPPATQAVDEFSETATWSPVTAAAFAAAAAADTRPPQLAFSSDAAPAFASRSDERQPPAAQPQSPNDLTSGELKELDDLDMLLITSDESFRPVTSQNPARPLTSEEKAGFPSNDISKIADGLPPNLSDVIFWPIGKDITLLKKAIALRRRRDEDARRRLHRRQGDNPFPDQKHHSETQRTRVPTTDERVSSFLAHYLARRRAPVGDSHHIESGGGERSSGRRRSAKSRRDVLRASILEKILAMEELLSET